jgi:putative addiction module component (TIGR02574 family)
MVQLEEILDLSVAERIQMVEKIWDSIDPAKIEMPATHEQELDRRLARYEKGETTFTTRAAIKNELHAAK